jgi:hypothetical protein
MTFRRLSLCLCLTVAVLAPVTAAGQRIASPYTFLETSQSISPFAAYFATGGGSIDLGPSAGVMFGARYGIRISGPFTLEAEAGFFPGTRAVLDTVPSDTTLRQIGEADFTALALQAGLRFNLTGPRTWHRLQPFVLFGGGVVLDFSGASLVDDDLPSDVRFEFGTTFAGQFGGGIEWYPSERLSMRLDARNVLWKLTTPEGFLTGDRALSIPGDEWTQNFMMSAGFAIHF